jgi:hypothetical protein
MKDDPEGTEPGQDEDEDTEKGSKTTDDHGLERPARELDDDERIDEDSMESFPASDPPSPFPGTD